MSVLIREGGGMEDFGGLEALQPVDDNPEQRCAVVLLLDTSSSMAGQPIQELNQGLRVLAEEVKSDTIASKRIDFAIVTFGGSVNTIDVTGHGQRSQLAGDSPFVTADQFVPPVLQANGDTPLGGAMKHALSLLRDRKKFYKANALDYYRPWILLITDGGPTDFGWQQAAMEARKEEDRKGVLVFGIGVAGANVNQLSQFSNRAPVMLQGLSFRELFVWLSGSLSAVSSSNPGEMIELPPVHGWAAIPT